LLVEVAVAESLADLGIVIPASVADAVRIRVSSRRHVELCSHVRNDADGHVGRIGQKRTQESGGDDLQRQTEAVAVAAPLGEESTLRWSSHTTGMECYDAGGNACRHTDGWLHGAIQILQADPYGQPLLANAANNGVVVLRGNTPVGSYGVFVGSNKTITVDRGMDQYSDWERADVLTRGTRLR
jgi:hypothetical protein